MENDLELRMTDEELDQSIQKIENVISENQSILSILVTERDERKLKRTTDNLIKEGFSEELIKYYNYTIPTTEKMNICSGVYLKRAKSSLMSILLIYAQI